MGRHKKYETNEEKLEAKRASARKSYHKRKGEKVIDEEFNRLMRLNPDLFTTKHKLNNEQKQFIKSLMNLPIETKPETKRITRHNESNAKKMLGLANSKIGNKKRKPIKSIDFDLNLLKSEYERQYFFENLPDVINKLLDSINFNTEHWTCSILHV